MANKSHYNSGLRTLNQMNRKGVKHCTHVETDKEIKTKHFFLIEDSIEILEKIPNDSVQLILIDPPQG